MALIFVDGFDDGLTFLGKWTGTLGVSPPIITASGRNGSGLQASGTAAGIQRAFAAAETDDTFIAGVAVNVVSDSGGAAGLMQFRSDITATVHSTLVRNIDGSVALKLGTASGATLITTDPNLVPLGVWVYVELKVVLHDSTGTAEIRINGVSRASDTGLDTKNGGTETVFSTFALGVQPTSAPLVRFDDLYVCNGLGGVNDDFLSDITIETILPNGNGASSQLLGSDGNSTDNYLLVDEAPPNTSDYNGSATTGEKDTYEFTNLAGATDVLGVVAHAYTTKSSGGTKQGRLLARPTSTDFAGADFAPTTTTYSVAGSITIWDLNPQTAAGWTAAEVNDSEFGMEVRT